jgi:4-amino-4-deoxy-L-arabinose transferase-like glycosyltransferase
VILWDAFYQYFLRAGAAPRAIAAGILIGFFVIYRLGIIKKCRQYLSKIPPKKWLLLILILGFALRLAWVVWSPYSPPAAGTEDMIMINHARDLVDGKGYIGPSGTPSANRPIGYALLLAGIFKLFGENLDVVALMNVFLILLTLWLVYKIGVTVGNEFVGLLGAFLVAIYPTSVFAARILLEEHIFVPMWLAGILLLILDYRSPSWSKILWAGILFAIGAHFRTYSFGMGFVAFFMWFIFKKNFRQALIRLIIIQSLIFLVALPWAIRNYYKMGSPIFYSTYVGGALYYSNNPTADVRWPVNPSPEQGGDIAYWEAKTEAEANCAGKAAAWKWIKQNPSLFVQKALGRGLYHLGLSREGWIVKDNFYTIRAGRTRPPEKLISKINRLDNDFYGVVFLLALFGMIICLLPKTRIHGKSGAGYLVITLLYYLAIVCLTLGHRKYRFPLEPIFCIFAAYGLSFFTRLRDPSDKTPAIVKPNDPKRIG